MIIACAYLLLNLINLRWTKVGAFWQHLLPLVVQPNTKRLNLESKQHAGLRPQRGGRVCTLSKSTSTPMCPEFNALKCPAPSTFSDSESYLKKKIYRSPEKKHSKPPSNTFPKNHIHSLQDATSCFDRYSLRLRETSLWRRSETGLRSERILHMSPIHKTSLLCPLWHHK